jgi:peptidoglycan/xylan/chitin deacetylase (PgdA/CDA1 family)
MQSLEEGLQQDSKLWELFTLKEDHGKELYDKTYHGAATENVLEPSVSMRMAHEDIRYPGDRKFAVCLTHDVDDIYPPFTHTLLSSANYVKKLDFYGLKDRILWRNKGKENSPYWNFKELMALEEKYGARSSFYFLSDGKDRKRFRYDVDDLSHVLGEIADKGWEVGLHGGYYAYDDSKEIAREKKLLEKALGRTVIGYRNHYLMFKVPDTWEHLAEAGFKYDTTIGYSNMIGFRNGMCHPYKPYDLRTGREIDILEIPLAIMDCALFDYAHSDADALEASRKIIDTVEKLNGVVTLLWHNNSMVETSHRASWGRLYEKLLEYCRGKNAWMTTGGEIYQWSKSQ